MDARGVADLHAHYGYVAVIAGTFFTVETFLLL